MDQRDLERLEVLHRKNADPAWENGDLYRLLYRPGYYVMAYERLKSSPGNMTPGPDGTTLDGFSMQEIESIIGRMRDESFQFSRARRQHIPKEKGGTRPLGIAPPRDKVVQEVMRMILEAIYDSPHGPTFRPSSHGFRPGRGCHTALKALRTQWSGTTWIVEGDVKAAFDNIDHDLLIRALRFRISDERFLNLVRKALTAGYYEFRMPVDSELGTPQGSVLSPILCNVFLHELDKFAEGLALRHDKGKERARNPEYRVIERQIERLRWKIQRTTDEAERSARVEELRALKKRLVQVPSVIDDGSYIRVKYLRYADDFVIGVNGPRALAEQLREDVAVFMRDALRLTLSMEKTHIRNAKTEEAFFLGTRVSVGSTSPRVTMVTRNGRTFARRTAGWTPLMYAPIQRLIGRLHSKGYCDAEGNPQPKLARTGLDDDQIVSMTGAVLNGLLNYYSFADNYCQLGRIQYILKFSAALTLATKHRLSLARVFARYGKELTVKVTTAKGKVRKIALPLETDWKKSPTRFLSGGVRSPEDVINTYRRLRTRSKLGMHCVVCDNDDGVVMHHLRHIRKMGEKVEGFSRLMATLNRKQIPVCEPCHKKIHKGQYDGLKLSDLANPRIAAY